MELVLEQGARRNAALPKIAVPFSDQMFADAVGGHANVIWLTLGVGLPPGHGLVTAV